MKILLLYDYPPPPSGLATQGDLLYHGLLELGMDVRPANFESALEKEWYYRWFEPDLVVGVGYWGHLPHIVLHPQSFGILAVPWLVADGYVANYQPTLNELPLVLVTSDWVREVYRRDGVKTGCFETLPVGCNVEDFRPRSQDEPQVAAIRQSLGVTPGQILILTVGGDAASKGAQEVMRALARLDARGELPPWKYVCKVWPQPRTTRQNRQDLKLARELGIQDHVLYLTGRNSREVMPYLMAACDIYAAPSRLEGFGMLQIEAGACARPVVSIAAMALLETQVQGETAFLAGVEVENRISEAMLGEESGFKKRKKVVFDPPRIADYRASVSDLSHYLGELMNNPDLRERMGLAGRQRVVENYDYRRIARRFLEIMAQYFENWRGELDG